MDGRKLNKINKQNIINLIKKDMNKDKKITYKKVNESFKPKAFKKVPMFENFLESKYCTEFALTDNKRYKITQDVIAEDGTILANAGDFVIYNDGMGVFGNKVEKFVSDCGAFIMDNGDALQTEIVLANDLVVDPAVEFAKNPQAVITELIAECRKARKPLSRKAFEALTPEQKKVYEEEEKLTDEDYKKFTAELDLIEIETADAENEEEINKFVKKAIAIIKKFPADKRYDIAAHYGMDDSFDESGKFIGKVNEEDDMEGLEDISEEDAKETIVEEIMTGDEVKEIMTEEVELPAEEVEKIISALPAEKEEYSMGDVVKAMVDAEIAVEGINTAIEEMVDEVVDNEENDVKPVNESAKAKIKAKITESLKKTYRRKIFENKMKSRKK